MSDSDNEDFDITHYLADYVPPPKKRPEGTFPECSICYEYMNNFDGPNKNDSCYIKYNDVIKVCPSNHIFHRGCILNSCYKTSDLCPLCKQQLLFNCMKLQSINKIPTNEINNYVKGGKKKSKRTKRNKKSKRSKRIQKNYKKTIRR